MEDFLSSKNIPKYVQCLLKLSGVNSIADLVDIDAEFVDEIEKTVRDGGFSNQIDFTLRPAQLKYLGGEYANIQEYKFRLMDRKKLLTISESAKNKLSRFSHKA